MPAALKLTLTTAGRAALRNAEGNGTAPVVVTQVGLTTVAFTPDVALKSVPNELKKMTTLSGGATATDTIHVTIRDTTSEVYSLRGLGLYLADGTLFGTYSQADVIGEKSAQASLLLALDVKFADINAASLTFGDTNFQMNKATSDVLGVVRLALNAEAITGTDTEKVMTPAADKAALDARLGANSPTSFFKQLLAMAAAADVRTALALKSAALKDEGAGKGLDADKLDGQEGDFYLQFANMKGAPSNWTPAPHTHAMSEITGLVAALAAKLDTTSRYVPGQIIVSAGKTAPPQTMLCNGAALSRTTFAPLFAAIGTTYGAGDGNTTFNIPNLGEGTVIKATIDPAKVGTYSAGSLLTHTHGATAAAVADHGHGFTINPAGGHGHGASSSGVGDHAHSAWTDSQGWHGHTGGTAGAGGHSHLQAVNTLYSNNSQEFRAPGGSTIMWGQNYRQYTDGVGDHGHAFSTDGAGTHGHNIGMNGAGSHAHDIYIGAVGDHNHGVALAVGGGHTHAVNITATGGTDNLAAGTHMFHFIAY